MMEQDSMPPLEQHAPATSAYEPPRIERVLTSDDLAREVYYAGIPPSVDGISG
jgi:hypothetical protein